MSQRHRTLIPKSPLFCGRASFSLFGPQLPPAGCYPQVVCVWGGAWKKKPNNATRLLAAPFGGGPSGSWGHCAEVAFEEAHLLRETLRQRRLALLEESVASWLS